MTAVRGLDDLVKSVAWSWSGSWPRWWTSQPAKRVNAVLALTPCTKDVLLALYLLSSMNRDAFTL